MYAAYWLKSMCYCIGVCVCVLCGVIATYSLTQQFSHQILLHLRVKKFNFLIVCCVYACAFVGSLLPDSLSGLLFAGRRRTWTFFTSEQVQ